MDTKCSDLTITLARLCMYAQNHVACPDAWDHSRANLEYLFQCTSHTVACFLAQNTVDGDNGVEWDVVIDHLCDMPEKSEEWWINKISNLINTFGGDHNY